MKRLAEAILPSTSPARGLTELELKRIESTLKQIADLRRDSNDATAGTNSFGILCGKENDTALLYTPYVSQGCIGSFNHATENAQVVFILPQRTTSNNEAAIASKGHELNKELRHFYFGYLLDPKISPYRSIIPENCVYKGENIYTPEFIEKHGLIFFNRGQYVTHVAHMMMALRAPAENINGIHFMKDMVDNGVHHSLAWLLSHKYMMRKEKNIFDSQYAHSPIYLSPDLSYFKYTNYVIHHGIMAKKTNMKKLPKTHYSEHGRSINETFQDIDYLHQTQPKRAKVPESNLAGFLGRQVNEQVEHINHASFNPKVTRISVPSYHKLLELLLKHQDTWLDEGKVLYEFANKDQPEVQTPAARSYW